ncbi:MAG: hypothetical protein O3C63_08690 [Cyanobacteria bacterium]|nr:hypothetical protein [Cyanobacteriota bacterium]
MSVLRAVLSRELSSEERRQHAIQKEVNVKLRNSFLNGFNNDGPKIELEKYEARDQRLLSWRLYNLRDRLDSYISSNSGKWGWLKFLVDNLGLLREKKNNPGMSKRDFLKLFAIYGIGTAALQREFTALPDEKLQVIASLFGHERIFERFILGKGSESLNLLDADKKLLKVRFDKFYDRYLESQKTGTAQALKMTLDSALFANGTDMVQRALAEAS